MDLPESTTHSFVIKIWLEETADEAGEAVWRGRVTHVPSGEHRYLTDLAEIAPFIMPHLEAMGVKLSLRERMSRWTHNLRGQKPEQLVE